MTRNDKLIILYLENNTLKDVGKEFGITHERVRQVLNRNGIKPRRSTPKPKIFKRKKTTADRFWEKVNITENKNECWLWKLTISLQGFGKFRMNKDFKPRTQYAHRVAWILSKRNIPRDVFIKQTCGNKLCCNPKHLKKVAKKKHLDLTNESGRDIMVT